LTGREVGTFIAPPRVGAIRGAINRTGIEGLSITLPELTIRMPSIELPSRYHSRSNARMMIESAQAPFVRTGFETVGMAQGQAVTGPSGGAAPRESAPLTDDRGRRESAPFDDIDKKVKEIEEQCRCLKAEAARLENLRRSLDDAWQKHRQRGCAFGAEESAPLAPQQAPPMPPQPEYNDEMGSRRQSVPAVRASHSVEQLNYQYSPQPEFDPQSTAAPLQPYFNRESESQLPPVVSRPRVRIKGFRPNW
jgi:hypothetical protein